MRESCRGDDSSSNPCVVFRIQGRSCRLRTYQKSGYVQIIKIRDTLYWVSWLSFYSSVQKPRKSYMLLVKVQGHLKFSVFVLRKTFIQVINMQSVVRKCSGRRNRKLHHLWRLFLPDLSVICSCGHQISLKLWNGSKHPLPRINVVVSTTIIHIVLLFVIVFREDGKFLLDPSPDYHFLL